MARAVFQVQSEGTDVASVDHIKVKRGQDKSLPVDEETIVNGLLTIYEAKTTV
jgi:hypothetical protein